jgi:FHA domain-containing protein
MTGATPQGHGERTQPMAFPLWPEVAGGWPSGRADRGPYADADTIDEPAAWIASQAGPAPPGPAPPGPAPPGPGPAASAPSGAGAGQGPPSASSGAGAGGGAGVGSGSGGPAAAREAGADWPGVARPPGSGGPVLAWLWGEQGQAGEYLLASRSVMVGRDPGSDIVLIDESVSHEHARIEYREGQWWLQPTDSAGPTWVNGASVEPGQRLPVTDGDRLRFGFHTQFRLLVPNAR